MSAHATEHIIPYIGAMGGGQARKACLDALDVFEELGERIQWLQSYVTEDRAYCIYATAGALTRKHAAKPRKPLDRISEVRRMMMVPVRAPAAPRLTLGSD